MSIPLKPKKKKKKKKTLMTGQNQTFLQANPVTNNSHPRREIRPTSGAQPRCCKERFSNLPCPAFRALRVRAGPMWQLQAVIMP